MHKRKKDQIVKRQKEHRQLLQLLPSRQPNSHQDDPLWYQIPEMGTEALIATLHSKRALQKALIRGVRKRKKLCKEKSLLK